MTEIIKSPDSPRELPGPEPAEPQKAPGKKPAGPRDGFRRLALLLLLLFLISSAYVLVTNGLYLWFSQPVKDRFAASSTLLNSGMPASAKSEQERLAYYDECIAGLDGQAEKLADLNNQFWTFAVLLKEDLNQEEILGMLDKIGRGRAAVRAYMQVVRQIQAEAGSFLQSAAQGPEPAGKNLADQLVWYADQLAAADHLADLYAGLTNLADLDLAGPQYSRQELGLGEVETAISPIRQPIQDLQALLASSGQLEDQLEKLYQQNPSAEQWGTVQTDCAEMLSGQQALDSQANALKGNLPQELQDAFQIWQAGLGERTAFIKSVQDWWQYTVQTEQSLASAATDRATAKRYIADSLEETDVETAYLWTKTAQEYRLSMNTAIDFANIYIGKANQQIKLLAESRKIYRPALGLAAAGREIAELLAVRAEAFWLSAE